MFLRIFTARLTALVIPNIGHGLTESQKHVQQMASIDLVEGRFDTGVDVNRAAIRLENGQTRIFEVLCCLIDSVSGSGFLRQLRPDTDGSGKIITEAHQRTSGSGLYAADDITAGLCQIVVATGEAAIAASHIHSRLANVNA